MTGSMHDASMASLAAAERRRDQSVTQRIVVRLLDDPRGGTTFPDHPVTLDGRELGWRTCDVALTMAVHDRRGGAGFERWCRALPAAVRYVAEQTAEFLKSGELQPDPTPTRQARDLANQAGLTGCPPLALVTPKPQAPKAAKTA